MCVLSFFALSSSLPAKCSSRHNTLRFAPLAVPSSTHAPIETQTPSRCNMESGGNQLETGQQLISQHVIGAGRADGEPKQHRNLIGRPRRTMVRLHSPPRSAPKRKRKNKKKKKRARRGSGAKHAVPGRRKKEQLSSDYEVPEELWVDYGSSAFDKPMRSAEELLGCATTNASAYPPPQERYTRRKKKERYQDQLGVKLSWTLWMNRREDERFHRETIAA